MPEAADRLTDTLLSAALRGRPLPTPPRAAWPALLASAGAHGVLPLLADAAAAAKWDRDLLAAMRPSVAAETALAMLREAELRRVLASLNAAGVTPLLFKGAHLAFTLYPSPDRRPRLDTDLLIKEADRDALRQCLMACGYGPVPHVTGEVAFTQFQYKRVDESGASHTLDIHWRIAVPKAFADRLSYDELMCDAVAVPRLGPHAFAPSRPLALVVACLHRTAHHGTTTRLLWLYDIHLIASQLTAGDWDVIVQRAQSCGLTPVVAAGLEHAAERLDTPVPSSVLDRLHAGAAATDPDVLLFLDGAPPQMQVAISDWRRISGPRARIRFLQEHLFPPASYIRHRYGISSRFALPFLYAHRAVRGAVKWLK
jgi:Uncharacterised nucleotidyltransferase